MPKLGITFKIMVAPSLVALALVFFGLYSARNIWLVDDLVSQLEVAVKRESTAQEVEAGVHSQQATAFRSLTLINLNKDKDAESLMSGQFEAADETERMLQAQADKPPFLDKLSAYNKSVREAYDAATSDPNLGAMMLQSASQQYDALVEQLQAESSASRLVEERAQRQFDATLGMMQRVQVITLVLAVLAGLGLAYFMARRLSAPLLQIREKLADIERTGELGQRVLVQSDDEVGETARSINALLDSVQAGVSSVSGTLQALADGDFSRSQGQADLRGDLGRMMQTVNATVDSLQHTMQGLDQIMASMSEGNFSLQIQLRARGAYQRTADQAIATLRNFERMLGDVGQVMQQVAQGQLSVRVTAQGRGELETLKDNINASLESLGQAMAAITRNARQVATAAAESSQAIGQISDGAQNQTHGISQVAAAVRQTATSVADVSRNTELASQKSRQSVAVLRDGLTKIERMVEVVHNIAASSEKINKITEVIESIANKTNLLSLNAAIEAARAGEHGKGFAVVADEVGKLAVNSAESSKEIAQLVQQAVVETAKAVAAVQAVSSDMTQIEMGSMETDDMLRRIASSLEEQSTAVEQINANLGNVDAIARSNAAASEEITATVMELARLADATRQEVARFSV